MNWKLLRSAPWLDTRAAFVANAPRGGALLDLGSSDGETLRHFYELRPDLKFHAVDLEGHPENYPTGCEFRRANLETDSLPWPDNSMDAITCMHVVEHLKTLDQVMAEIARLLKPGGRAYIETPHPRTLSIPASKGSDRCKFTLNFFDDPTHIRPVPIEEITDRASKLRLVAQSKGISRNFVFAAMWPAFALLPPSRQKYTSKVHWIGWSAYTILAKPL